MAKEEKKSRIVDMTQGSPGRLILSFALPLMLGNVFQQLYTFVDTLVVGFSSYIPSWIRWWWARRLA